MTCSFAGAQRRPAEQQGDGLQRVDGPLTLHAALASGCNRVAVV